MSKTQYYKKEEKYAKNGCKVFVAVKWIVLSNTEILIIIKQAVFILDQINKMKPKVNKLENIKLEHLNFKTICRFCLSDCNILLPIFGHPENDGFFELQTSIKTLVSVELEEDDGLPSLICHCCLYNFEQSLKFKKQCEQVDFALRNYMKEQNLKNKNNAIEETEKNESDDSNNQECPPKEETTEMKDSACQAEIQEEVTPDCPDTSVEIEVVEEIKIELDEKVDFSQQASSEENCGNDQKSGPSIEPDNSLQMEENMNDMEENMFGNEPFSLDLCSVRLQSESKSAGVEDAVIYPTTQLTDEEQWSESGSDASDEFDNVEPVHVPVGNNHCPACNKGFVNVPDLQRHQLIHKQEPPYPCDYCQQEFEEKTLLKAHWRSHAKNRPHMCLTCGAAYAERADLLKHFAIHDVIKPYHCPGCGKAFAYKSDLRKHAIIHTGARPFKCPVCGKTFTRSTNLNKHARVHSGRRPYPCEHCDKMFSSRGDLVRHAVIHTGEKPYACLICSLAFNRKDKLSRHERVHMIDRPFVCNECPTSFHRKEELTKHCKFHHFKPDPMYFMPIGNSIGLGE